MIRRIVLLLILLATVCSGATNQKRYSVHDTVLDEGFEAARSVGELRAVQIVKGNGVGHSGASCAAGFEPGPQKSVHDVRFELNLNPDSLYRAELWLRSDNKCAASVGLAAVGSPDNTEGLITRFYEIPEKWTKYSAVFRASSSDMRIFRIIFPHAWAGPSGKVWLDDVRITEIASCKSMPFTPITDNVEDCALARTGADSAQLVYQAHVAGTEKKLSGKDLALQQANDKGLMGLDHEEGYDRLVTMAYASGKWSTGVELAREMIFHPAIACAKDGGLCAAWTEKDKNGWVIRYRLRSRSGWSGSRSASAIGMTALYPAVAADASGSFWCAWTYYDGPDCRISLARLTPGGVRDVRVLSAKGRNAYKPDVALDARGRLWVAWHEFDGESYNVVARRMSISNRNGRPYALPEGELLAIAHTGEDEAHVSITPSPTEDGGVWFAYDVGKLETNAAPWGRPAVGQRLSMRNEIARWKDGHVTALYPTYGDWPLSPNGEHGQVVFDANKNLWLLERSYRRTGFGWDVIARRCDGGRWLDPIIVSGGKQGFDHYPGVVNLRSGTLLTWQADDRDRQQEGCIPYGSRSYLLSRVIPHCSKAGSEPKCVARRDCRQDSAAIERPNERFRVDYNGKKLYVFWGDLHVHSRLSRCAGNGDLDPFDAYAYPHDILGLDFMALTDHGAGLTVSDRYNTRKLASLQNNPPYFVSFLAQEASSCRQSGENGIGYGHRNIIFLDQNYRLWWDFFDTTKNTPSRLWEALEETHADAFTIPHQLADRKSGAETDWSFRSDKWQPVAEVFQIRGSYEYKGCPWQSAWGSSEGNYYQDALEMGHHLGAIAGSDHGGGQGLVAVFAEKLDRETIFRAIQARQCYGTTEARMLLDFRVNGSMMGEIIKDNGGPRRVSVRVEALQPLKEIVVFKNGKTIFTRAEGLGQSESADFQDTASERKEDWYYLRAIQADGRIAWSSPIWVERGEGRNQ